MPTYRDTHALILKKTKQLLSGLEAGQRQNLALAAQDARFLTADARETGTLMDGCITLTVTSPPFLDVVDYSGDNWLRYDGAHTPAAPATPVKDAQGIAEESAAIGEAVSVVTDYSYLAECSEALALGDYVKPAADGSGKAAKGTLTDHCGRAGSA